MAVPKKRHSNARTGSRRAHDALKLIQINVCKLCGAPKLPHRVCPTCKKYERHAGKLTPQRA